jgi:hypothetical protein
VESPHDSVEFDVLDHFSFYFLHDPLDFVFTLAENLAKIENFLIFLRSRSKRLGKRNQKIQFCLFFLRLLIFCFSFSIFVIAEFSASVNTKSSVESKWEKGSIHQIQPKHMGFQPKGFLFTHVI